MLTVTKSAVMTACEGLNPKEIQISILVWEGLTNHEIGRILGASKQVIKNHLRSAFDTLEYLSQLSLELAMYIKPTMVEKIGLSGPSGAITWARSKQSA